MTATTTLPSDRDDSHVRELGRIARLSPLIAIAQFGLVTMGLVDTAILGHVSAADLAGASIGRNIGFAAQTISIGLAMALEPLAAQAIGAREPERAWSALVTTIKTLALIWFPSMLFAGLIASLLGPLGVEADVIPRARVFLWAQAPGLFFFAMFLAQKTFLQAHRSTRPALVASVVANVINFVLCNLLVRGDDALVYMHLPKMGLPSLGVLGGGIATSVASLVLAGVLYVATREFRPRKQPDLVPARLVLRLGIPSGLHMLAEVGGFVLVSILAARLGKSIAAANQVALGLASFTFMGALGVSGATAVRVGHRIGEGRSPRQSGLLGIGLGACFMIVGAILFACFPEPLVAIFTKDPEIILLGSRLLRIAAVFQLFDGVQAVGAGALRGAGDMQFVFIAGVCAYWLVGVPLAILFGFYSGYGAVGMWWGLTISLILCAIAYLARFIWLTRKPIKRVD